jgi:TrmH family RNA methyltransferase
MSWKRLHAGKTVSEVQGSFNPRLLNFFPLFWHRLGFLLVSFIMKRMKSSDFTEHADLAEKFKVILARPENPENVGLVARCMKNTGFEELRLVSVEGIDERSRKTAVHAQDILDRTRLYSNLIAAVEDLELVFAATSKKRKNFPAIPLLEAVENMFHYPPSTKIGLLFGNERTGLISDELRSSNFRFSIPQSGKQPSYNLASAVLLTLFHIYTHGDLKKAEIRSDKPLSRKKQEESIRLILDKLEKRNFIHETNRRHMTDMVYDLFGRLALTEKDRKLVLALFSKVIDR